VTPEQIEARANRCRQIAHLGGLATREKYGRDYFRKVLGPAGFASYAEKYFDGDRHAAMNSLTGRGKVIGGHRWHGSVKVNPAQMEKSR
jgi:hypothetical protein